MLRVKKNKWKTRTFRYWTEKELNYLDDDDLINSIMTNKKVMQEHFPDRTREAIRAKLWRQRTGYTRAKTK